MDIKGKALLGGCISQSRSVYIQNLAAVYIDFSDRANISISHVISPAIVGTYRHIVSESFFLSSDILGFWTRTSFVVLWSMKALDEVQTSAQVGFSRKLGSCCLAYGDRVFLYLLIKGPAVLLPRPALHSFASNQGELYCLGNSRITNWHLSRAFVPNFGIFAVASKSVEWDNGETASTLFWAAHASDGILNIGPAHLHHHHHLEGSINHIAAGISGTDVLILARREATHAGTISEGQVDYLGLLHFNSTPKPHATFRELDVGDLDPGFCCQIAFDDTLGLVLAVDRAGNLTAIWYS
ncbi:hypothetical protein MVEN_00262800 [Mycena venus]|uniref:Uncharacterized protein n=1 Tax=Mycena venus TaxID=2733690 RepID=A0A8H7DDV0_9AGAR|nr:hypothetical protein MVEN_00262800 [Mycena venus]